VGKARKDEPLLKLLGVGGRLLGSLLLENLGSREKDCEEHDSRLYTGRNNASVAVSREEHRELKRREITHPRLRQSNDVAPFNDQPNHPSDHPQLAPIQHGQESRDHSSKENVGFLLPSFLVFGVWRDRRRSVPDDVELGEAGEKEGEDGKGLGWREMSKKSRKNPLSFGGSEKGDKRMREAVGRG